MPVPTKLERRRTWFEKHVWEHPTRRKLLIESVPGDDRWLTAVPLNMFPKDSRYGAKNHSFRCELRKIAREHLQRSGEVPMKRRMFTKEETCDSDYQSAELRLPQSPQDEEEVATEEEKEDDKGTEE